MRARALLLADAAKGYSYSLLFNTQPSFAQERTDLMG